VSQSPIRLELPMAGGMASVNVYLFTTPEVVLVDTGPSSPIAWAALEHGLAGHGLAVADVARVVVTHPHHDHYAQAGRIAAAGPAQVWIAEVGAAWLLDAEACQARRFAYYRDEFLPATALPATEQAQVRAEMEAIFASISLPPRERVRTFPAGASLALGGLPWTVLHLPGHSEAQTCLYQPETRQLLASDMLLPVTPTPVIDAPPLGRLRGAALPQFLDSLARVETLALDQVYPGHGAPFDNPHDLIDAQRARIARRMAECLAHIRSGHTTIAALYAAMYSGRDAARAGMAGVWMLVGYTDLLRARGAIDVTCQAGVWHFHAT
jgi:glyoxylase-like metal-dependent hydrolase (beta-lactamase superfamily II)